MSGWDKKRTVMQGYEAAARMYDRLYAAEQRAKIEAALRNMKLKDHELTLDVGCGTGVLFEYVADGADAIVGVDFSKKTLLQARERVRDKNLDNVQLIRADADNMPFGGRIFGRIFAMTVVQNAPNPDETLTEIKRVAKKEAVCTVTGLKKIFRRQTFEQLLKNARLKILTVEDEHLQCYVAVCTT